MEEQELRSIASQLSCPKGDAGVNVGNEMNDLNQFITSHTIRVLSPQRDESIVEIGPGNGILSVPILEALGKDGRYLGIELSAIMADEAKLTLSGKGSFVEIFNGNCLDANVRPSSVDGVIAVNVLYFIEDLTIFFKQLFSWLKPDGRAVFGIRSDKALLNLPFTQYGFNIRTTDGIKSVMKQAGFTSILTYEYEEEATSFEDISISVDTVILIGKKTKMSI